MENSTHPKDAAPDAAMEELAQLRRFRGPPAQFWPRFLAVGARLTGATRSVLVLREAGNPPRLGKIAEWSAPGHADRAAALFQAELGKLAEEAFKDGTLLRAIEPASGGAYSAIGATLPLPEGQPACAVLFLLPPPAAGAAGALRTLQLLSDLPSAYQAGQAAQRAQNETFTFAAVMDVLALVNKETRYRAACLTFCNALADRFRAERVSLGWLEHHSIRLKTISRTERFNRSMAAAQGLEVAMEECLDQNAELVWPAPEGFPLITRDTARFAEEQKPGNVLSVPLRVGDSAIGVVLCERQKDPFTQLEMEQVRLSCDQVARRLSELHRTDRWFGARWQHTARASFAKLLGPEHTWAKVLAGLGTLLLVTLLLPIYPYRVEGTFILRSDEVSFLTAPFDGYIKGVDARPGDRLAPGASLIRLNTDDLELEERGAVADRNRYVREAEKARAAKAFAEMRIAEAQAEQAAARLDLARYRLGQAHIKTPFEGVIVEGDLRQRIGAPVKQGDALMKLARLDTLYVEAEIHERDAHEILGKVVGEVAFVAQPRLKYPIRVVQLEPASVPKEKRNVFLLRCAIDGPVQPWWRPGMSGVCKVSVGPRTPLWVLTHRTVDFFRLLLWW
jgi:biotin carboxyl carrier protein